MDGWTDGRTNGRTDGWETNLNNYCAEKHLNTLNLVHELMSPCMIPVMDTRKINNTYSEICFNCAMFYNFLT